LQLNPGNRPWQYQGIVFHEQQAMLNKRRNLSRYGLDKGNLKQQVSLRDNKTGIHGIADAIIFQDDRLSVLEFKISGDKPARGQILQLAAYAIMAQSQYNLPCRQGFILFGTRGKTHVIPVDKSLCSKTRHTIAQIRNNLEKPLLPGSPASSEQCGQCEYFNFCGDRE
jgi:CRISPR-associated exonuclease Cas4